MERCGCYSEKTYRHHFSMKTDFFQFNHELAKQECTGDKIIAVDCSYLPKSGKHTPCKGIFWNGSFSKAMSGLELSVICLIDIEHNTALPLECELTPAKASDDDSRVKFYAEQIIKHGKQLSELSHYIVADGYYSKKRFIDAVTKQHDLHLISKLRKDADCRYFYHGEQKGRGRPRCYAGKVKWDKLSTDAFKIEFEDEEVIINSAIVNSKTMKRSIRVVHVYNKRTQSYALLFSTNTALCAFKIYQYYKARFQIEFLFRDAKQYTGLTHCQARKECEMYFHYNASLTSIGLAKVCHYWHESHEEKPYSISDIKTRYFNELLLNQVFLKLEIDPSLQKIVPIFQELSMFGCMAA